MDTPDFLLTCRTHQGWNALLCLIFVFQGSALFWSVQGGMPWLVALVISTMTALLLFYCFRARNFVLRLMKNQWLVSIKDQTYKVQVLRAIYLGSLYLLYVRGDLHAKILAVDSSQFTTLQNHRLKLFLTYC